MKKAYFRTCPECGVALDPDEVCICQAEKETDNSEPVLDDAIEYFEIEPETDKPITLVYRWADEYPKQWYVFCDNYGFGNLYNCTLQEALLWIHEHGYISLDAVEFIQKDIEKTLQEKE